MPGRGALSADDARSSWLRPSLLILIALGALRLAAAVWSPPPHEWAHFIEVGDTLARVGGTMATRHGDLTARAAYLLAFHHAQDAEDVPRMLVAADRLDRLGDHDLATHIRHVARTVVAATQDEEPAP